MCIISYSLSQGGCDAGVRHSDKVLGNPEKEAWEEAEGRREERTCSCSCGTSPGGPAWRGRPRRAYVRGLVSELPDSAGLGRGWFF